ncbi:MAG: hypothetical protein ACNA8L_14050 [Luteolibacter sp.]
MKLPEIEDLLPEHHGDLEISDIVHFFHQCTIDEVESKIYLEPYYAVTCFENVGIAGMKFYAPAVASYIKSIKRDESYEDLLGRFLYCFHMRGVPETQLRKWGLIY